MPTILKGDIATLILLICQIFELLEKERDNANNVGSDLRDS